MLLVLTIIDFDRFVNDLKWQRKIHIETEEVENNFFLSIRLCKDKIVFKTKYWFSLLKAEFTL